MLNLFVKETTVQSSTVAVSWCLEKKVIDKLNQRLTLQKDEGLYLLLVVAHTSAYQKGYAHKEMRKLVPITDPFAYVDFKYPGENNIFAVVVWGTKSRLHDDYVSRESYRYCGYANDVLCYDLSTFNEHFLARRLRPGFSEAITATLAVQVPEECFAKEPPEWEKAWVNWLHRGDPFDQCEYRNRRIWAYSLQLFILFPLRYVIGALAVLVLMLFGTRKVGYGFLGHPLRYDLEDTWYYREASIFSPRRRHEGDEWRILLIPLMPIIWIAAGMGGMLGAFTAVVDISLWHGFLMGIGVLWVVCYGVILMGAVVIAVLWLIRASLKLVFPGSDGRKTAAQPTSEPKPPVFSDLEMNDLVCSMVLRPLSLRELPKERRTVRLRFYDLKARVCRPFRG